MTTTTSVRHRSLPAFYAGRYCESDRDDSADWKRVALCVLHRIGSPPEEPRFPTGKHIDVRICEGAWKLSWVMQHADGGFLDGHGRFHRWVDENCSWRRVKEES